MMSCILIIFVFLQLKGLTDCQTIHVCTSGNGEQCNIDCETSDQNNNIAFTHPQRGSAGGCSSGGTCGSGLGLGYTVARVNSTFTRLTIPSLNCTADSGNWTCSYGAAASTPKLLPCPSSLGGGGGLTIDVAGNNVTCQLNCQSPISGFSSLQLHKIQSGTTSLLQTVTSITGSTPAAADGCNSGEQNVILSRDVSDVCGPSKFRCTFNNIYLGSANSSESAEIPLTGCQSTTVLSSTVQSSTTKSPLVCKYCLISDCLLLWQCILVWIAITLAVMILIGCCVFCLWKHRQKSEKDENIDDIKIQNLKDKSGNNLDVNNDDKTDLKSNDNPGYDHV